MSSLLFVLSAMAFSILISPAETVRAVIFLITGTAAGIAACILKNRTDTKYGKAVRLTAAVFSLFICFRGAVGFFESRRRDAVIRQLIGKVLNNYETGLRGLSILLALTALPFLMGILSPVFRGAFRFFTSIQYREIFAGLFGKDGRKKRMRSLAAVIGCVAASAIVGTLLLCLAYMLPVDRIWANMRSSAKIIREEKEYPVLSEKCTSRLDNYTDAEMLLEASDLTDAPVIKKAMNIYRGVITQIDPATGNELDKVPSRVFPLHFVDHHEFTYTTTYARYWHGYLIFLKPLLEFMNYGSLRVLNGIIQLLLTGFICVLSLRKGLGTRFIPILIIYGMLMPLALAKCMEYSLCFYIFMVGTAALLLTDRDKISGRSMWIFLFIGISTAYFDFLTYPIAAFGIPAVFFLALTESERTEQRIISLIRCGLSWCAGYGGMWASKWILAGLLTGENILRDAFDTVLLRTSGTATREGGQISLLNCERVNYKAFFTTPFAYVLGAYLVISLIRVLAKVVTERGGSGFADVWEKTILYIVVSFAPVIWFAFARNHSHIHWFFTNKACSVSVLAVCFALESLIGKRSSSVK